MNKNIRQETSFNDKLNTKNWFISNYELKSQYHQTILIMAIGIYDIVYSLEPSNYNNKFNGDSTKYLKSIDQNYQGFNTNFRLSPNDKNDWWESESIYKLIKVN